MKYKNEVEIRFKDTALYNEYLKKSKDYSNDKYKALEIVMNNILMEFSVCMKSYDYSSKEALELVKKLQNHITNNYYHCSNDVLLSLGNMYISDIRFKNNIDKFGDGTALFIYQAIKFYVGK